MAAGVGLLAPPHRVSPELRVGRKQKSKNDESRWGRPDDHRKGDRRQSAKVKQNPLSDSHFGTFPIAGLSMQPSCRFFCGLRYEVHESDFRPLVRPADDRSRVPKVVPCFCLSGIDRTFHADTSTVSTGSE